MQCNYVSVDRSTASTANTFYAGNSINGGNNVNWVFGGFIELAASAYTFAANAVGLVAHHRLAIATAAYTFAASAIRFRARSTKVFFARTMRRTFRLRARPKS